MSVATAPRNGTATEAVFPLDSFREAAAHLRRPFTPAAVKFKVQATWPKENPTGGLIVAYIDARLAVERLNLIVPHLWHDHYEPQPKGLLCLLTVDGITRKDIGEGVVKGLYSDALKRAAVKFGVGVSLYAIPKMILSTNDQLLKQRRSREGQTLELTPTGEARVRKLYADWLAAHGVKAFGEPLDHGDSENAQGDAEVDQEPVAAASESGEVVDAAGIAELQAAANRLTVAQIKLALSSERISPPEPFFVEHAFDAVPSSKAAALAQRLAGTERKG